MVDRNKITEEKKVSVILTPARYLDMYQVLDLQVGGESLFTCLIPPRHVDTVRKWVEALP